jgi:hypothetical protein
LRRNPFIGSVTIELQHPPLGFIANTNFLK